MSKKVSAVIVNYKTPELVIDCLESLYFDRANGIDFSVFVVDNNSGDNSYDKIKSEVKARMWGLWVTVLSAEKNGGFSYGNNIGIKKSLSINPSPDYIWLLNPDTLIHKNACKELINFFEKHAEAGIIGSRLEDPDGTSQMSAFRDFTVISEMLSGFRFSVLSRLFSKWLIAPVFISKKSHKTAWVAGASMMIRSKIFQDIGFLDEDFFLYYEEVDFCVRSRRYGWECWYVPESRVIHLVGAATGISDLRKKAPRRPVYWFESRRLFFLKNYCWFKLLLADLLWMLGYSTYIFRKKLQHKIDLDPPHYLKDFFSNSIVCKGIKY